jgi:peroxiredoxin
MRLAATLALAVSLWAAPAYAMLAVGQTAPDFRLSAAKNGEVVTVDSQALRRRGPVVVYFYPAAFTPGCSLEAKLFADQIPTFERMNATVVGISGDDINTLKEFSVAHCRGRFPVASDTGLKVAKQFDATSSFGGGFAARISYVIDSSGKVRYALNDSNPSKHVEGTLNAVQLLSLTKQKHQQ